MLLSISCEKNNPPSKSTITAPNNGDSIELGSLVTITVDAVDIDGSISEVRFNIGGVDVGSSTTFPYKYKWNTSEFNPGRYTIKATAKDNSGESTSDEINVVLVSKEIPNIPFNVSLNINLPLYAKLQYPLGGIVFYNSAGAGSKGLAILRVTNDEFVIYDRHCAYKVQNGCVIEEDENEIGGLIDLGCCNSKFNMINGGFPSGGPAVNGLKPYNYTFNGTVLNIFN